MRRTTISTLLVLAAAVGAQWIPISRSALAQTAAPGPAAAPAAPTPAQPVKPSFTQAEVEALVAPLALYPDSLLSQIFMASTYPLEVVQADRFCKANPKLTGEPLTKELEKQEWDASVKSLVNFPTVLAMMSEKLDSTIKLGDAFLADQAMVMGAVQTLRGKAQSQGNLQTTKEQTVIIEKAPETQTQIIKIEPANPQVVYVPTYNPTVVYGSWPYPSYPPYYYHPPGYVAAGAIGFGLGVAAGAAWGYAWGNCNWGGNDIDIDCNRNTNINNNIDRSKYQNQINQLKSERGTGQAGDRAGNRTGQAGDRAGNRAGSGNSFQHNPAHRQGVAYRDQGAQQRYGGASNKGVQSREAYRGRADAGRQDLNRGGASQYRGANAPSPSVGNRASPGAGAGQPRANTGQVGGGNRGGPSASPSIQNRSTGGGAQNRSSPSVSNRSTSSANRSSGGFSGAGGGGRATQSASQRGASSRGYSGGGASRGGGGGSRGGGGGRGGGGRR